jgi:protein O-GlcNAc transferase
MSSELNAAFVAAVSRHQAGDVASAAQQYNAILQSHPSHAPSLCNLGTIHVRNNQLQDAVNCYNLALAAEPGYPDAHFNLGNLYRRTNQLLEAEEQYRHCLANKPDHGSAAFNLGLVLSAIGNTEGAVECFRLVAKLEPTNAEGFSRLGDSLLRCGRFVDGIAAFRRAIELKPTDPRGFYNLGLALSNAGEINEAAECIQKALKANPSYAEAHNALGLNLEAQGRKDDALFHYQKAVELKPDLADAWSNMGTNLAEQGRSEEAIKCLRESLRIRPMAPAIHSNLLLLLNYSSHLELEAIRDEHFAWAERFAGPTPDAAKPLPPYDPTRKLRIGYMSGDYRHHTVAGFIEQLLTHHDREQFEVFAYATNTRSDEVTEKFKTLADHWRPLVGQTDEQAFKRIQFDRIDILVDISGHTAGNRLLIFAARPACVQALVFGYPNTTGMRAIDYRITDPVSDPPEALDHLYAEKLLHLPGVAWVYRPPENAPPVGPLPAASSRMFTLGCMNNPAKISEACLQAWINILKRVPGTRLMLLAGQSQAGSKRLLDRFMQAGVLRDRVEMMMRVSKEQYLSVYNQFDVTLDPFPYNGGVTTADSLFMGVPVITLAGRNYVSRQGVMVNSLLELDEFTADSPETLPELVKDWMGRRAELAQLRAGLRDRLLRSPLTDGPNYVRELEQALRKAWASRLPA